MSQENSFWKDVYVAIETGGRIEGILEPSRALILLDTRAGDTYHLYINTDKVWANHVGMDIQAIMNSFRLARLKREKLYIHVYGPPLIDEDRLKSLTFPISAKINIRKYDVEQNEADLRDRALALALDKQRKSELKKRFGFGKPQIVYVIMIITFLIMWLAESLGSTLDPYILVRFGAKVNSLIIEGEWWRFITPIFLHIGWFHFAINMFALWSLGPLVERMYGSIRFFIIYLLAGVIATAASFAFSEAISAGASGALFGLVGALLYFGLRDRSLFMKTLGPPLFIMLGLNVGLAFILGASLDHSAHAGGLLGGFLVAGIVGLPDEKASRYRLLFTVLATTLTSILFWYGYTR